MWVETFTGLPLDQFHRLVRVVRERGGEGPRTGRPWCLPLDRRVLLVAVYYRTNLTMRQMAPPFGVSPATVCRVIQRLGPLLAVEPVRRPLQAEDRLWIVDGTLVPVRDRRIAASSRNYRYSANVQVVVDADSRLVVATGRPVPGNRSDAQAWRATGLADDCRGVALMADSAYINTGMAVPHRKRPGRPLLPAEEDDNADHRHVRVRVEHAIGRMKNWKILRDCRQHGDGLHTAAQAIAQLHNLTYAA
ncbi:hypothetical protein GCM10023205_71040 [Yinghuangia aomiensis]|uniref:Helix-turn-helix of DDE superfamily endonuclease n=1 Tax=Yinghuangia aomiensis TaxID=676205 RepID=A0ABP9I743_9ACTN